MISFPNYFESGGQTELRTLKSPVKNSVYVTVISLFNATVGLSIYEMPNSINQAGYVVAIIIALVIIPLEHYCVVLLFRIKSLVADEKATPFETYEDAVLYLVSEGPKYLRKMALPFKYILKAMLVGYPLGLGTLNVVHVASILTQMHPLSEDTTNSNRYYSVYLLCLLLLLNCLREGTVLAILSHFSIFLTIVSMGIIFSLVIKEKMILTIHMPYGKIENVAVYMSSIMLAYESISSVIASDEDMIHSENLNISLSVVLPTSIAAQILYLALGFSVYWRYGVKSRPTILLNLQGNMITDFVKILICTYNLISYPQQCYPVFNVMWYHGLEQYEFINGSKYLLMYEYIFRIGVAFATVVLALVVPSFQSVLQIIGSLIIPNLIFVFPAIMDYTYSWRFSHQEGLRPPLLTITKDLLLLIFGLFIVLIIGPGILYNVLIQDQRK